MTLKLFETPIQPILNQVRIKQGIVDIYALAWDGYDQKVVAMLYGGRKMHVKAAWAAIMSNNDAPSFWLPRHGYMTLRKVAGKDMYRSRDFVLPCGASVKFTFVKCLSITGLQSLRDEPSFYYLVGQGNQATEAIRFSKYLQSSVMVALRPSQSTGVHPRWAWDLIHTGKKNRLIEQIFSEGLTIWRVSRDSNAWQHAIMKVMRQGAFPSSDEGF